MDEINYCLQNSADSESMFSTSVPNTLSMVDPTLISESSDDEDPENTVAFWKEKYQQLLEAEKPNPVSKQDFESQCSFEDPTARIEIEILQSQLNALQHQVTSLNLQLLALSNENSNTDRVQSKCELFSLLFRKKISGNT